MKYFYYLNKGCFLLVLLCLFGACGQHNDDTCDSDEHNHEKEKKEEAHASGEIVFEAAHAKEAGLQIEVAKRASFASALKVSGQLSASPGSEVTVVAAANGVVAFPSTTWTEGSAIQKGKVLALLSSRNLMEGDLVQKVRVDYETAQKELARAETLAKDRLVSQKELEQVQLRYTTARTAYEGLSSKISSQGIQVVAPIAGFVKQRLVAAGEYVSMGQPLAVLTQTRRLQLIAQVGESDYTRLAQVTSAHFRTASSPDVNRLSDLEGKLISIGKNVSEGAYYIPITFEFNNVGAFVPGSFAEIWLLEAEKENVFSVPLSALTEEQGLFFVYIQLDKDCYRKQEVKIGHDNGLRVEILSGLKEGNRVVTHGATQVKLASYANALPAGHNHSH